MTYLDPTQPVEYRVEDLLARMTVEEKIAQLGSAWVFQLMSRDEFSPDQAAKLCPHGLGQVTRLAGASSLAADAAARVANQIQRHLIENTRLGIPAIVHEEICSGLMARGSTIYPQAIGVASTFEVQWNEAIADAIRVQMRKAGSHQGLSPVLDVVRDPRWGRTEETYGEDPHLVAMMGAAFVKGLQGDDLKHGVIATPKHFVGYGASEGGLNWAPAHIGGRELRDVYLHPFEASVIGGKARSVMNAYHELDGVPCAGNGDLVNGLLRDTWGFDGIVVSDYFAVDQLAAYHRLAANDVEAAAMAIRAGIDSELPSTDCYDKALQTALSRGDVTMETVDTAVRRTLGLKFELGLFENPYVDENEALNATNTSAHRTLAAKVARKSLVLLRNDGILPLPTSPGRIAVIGPNADSVRNLFGDYSYPAHIESLVEMRDKRNVFEVPIPDDVSFSPATLAFPTILDGIRARFGDNVRYAKGCEVNDTDTDGIAEAVALARDADVVVLVVGDKAGLTTSCTSGESRDRSSLDLPGIQEDLARAIMETGTPVITVLVVGRPCGSVDLHENSAAVLLAWLPGQEGGDAVAAALAGEFSPGGKLPMTFPRSVGQVPVFYGHKISGGRSHWQGDYVDGPASPLYPFGYGLSYSIFELVDPVLETPNIGAGESVLLSVTVQNVGDMAGEEVVQVYIRDVEASITRPVRELKAFIRVALEPGASSTVRFEIPIGQLGFYDSNLDYVVEEGEIEIAVGTSSQDVIQVGNVLVKTAGPIAKVFDGSRNASENSETQTTAD